MKRLLLLSVASLLSLASLDAPAMASRNATGKLTPDQLANLPDNANYVSGGESVDRAVSPEVLTAIANMPTTDGQAVYGRYTAFGEDVAPDAHIVDTEALKAKNDLDGVVDTLTKSASPQAAFALEALKGSRELMKGWTAPVPQGDRKGGSQLAFMKGTSSDVAAVAKNDAEQLAIMRLRQFPRANASVTTTRTAEKEWTEPALATVVTGVVAYLAYDLEMERLEQENEGKLTAAAMEEEDKAAAAVGAPAPVRTEPSDAAAYVAKTYPGVRLGGANDGPASERSLWKPASDNDGNLVVVLPHSAMGKIISMTVGGEKQGVGSIGNKWRPHIRFSKPGGAYAGQTFTIQAESGTWAGTAPGAKRTEPLPMTKTGAAIPVSQMPVGPGTSTPGAEVPAGQGEPVAP